MNKLSHKEKEKRLFQSVRVWFLFIFFIGFTSVGLMMVLSGMNVFGINVTKLQFQVKSGWQFLIFGILFFIGWILTLRYYKKNRFTERTSE